MMADIVRAVQNNSGRFLSQDDVGWLVVSDEVARQKVGHTFRTLRSTKNKKSEACKLKSKDALVHHIPIPDGHPAEKRFRFDTSTPPQWF